MKVRLLTALGIAIVGLPILIFSEYVVYTVALGILSAIAVWELLRVFGLHKSWAIAAPSYLIAFAMPALTHKSVVSSNGQTDYILTLALVMFLYLLYLAAVAVLDRGRLGYNRVASVFMSFIYVVVSFTSMGLLRYMSNGVYLFEMVFIGAWVSDSMAYFTGRLLGKHKLAPTLSPKKTIEGSIGGIAFTVIAFVLYGLIISGISDLSPNYLLLAVMGGVLSAVSQIGDLWASLIKREYGIKDYSKMLPGHGGVMDRFDSVLSISTILMIFCILFSPFA